MFTHDLCTGTAALVLARPLDKEGVTGLASLSLRNKIPPEGTDLMYEFHMYSYDTLQWFFSTNPWTKDYGTALQPGILIYLATITERRLLSLKAP
jgi:hypothetical protein